MSPVARKVAWTVTAGLILGEVEHEYTREFVILSTEWADEKTRDRVFADRCGAAHAWAAALEYAAAGGRAVNWVHVEFIWY